MGKGDRKTAKGKRYNASYGNARSQGGTRAAAGAAAPAAKKTVAKPVVISGKHAGTHAMPAPPARVRDAQGRVIPGAREVVPGRVVDPATGETFRTDPVPRPR